MNQEQIPSSGTSVPAEDPLSAIREKAAAGGIRVLFIGDSLTYYNEMPVLFGRLCAAAGKKVTADSVTKGGTSLHMMRGDPDLWGRICDKITSSEPWDAVVVQTTRNHTVMTEYFPYYPYRELCVARELCALIRGTGAVPILYSTFGVTAGSVTRSGHTKVMDRKTHTDLVTVYNAAVAADLGVTAVYAGESFNRVYAEGNDIDLYHTDRKHPSPAGSYLIACDFYAVIFGESPVGLEYLPGMDARTAQCLQAAAAGIRDFVPGEAAVIREIEEEPEAPTETAP